MIKKLFASAITFFPGAGHFVMGHWKTGIALFIAGVIIINVNEAVYMLVPILSIIDIWRRDFSRATKVDIGEIKMSEI